jgi:hypothetical protein
MARSSVAHSLATQRMAPALDLTAGLNGYRLAFVGGPIFDVIEEFPTLAEAGAAYRAAKLAADRLDQIARPTTTLKERD